MDSLSHLVHMLSPSGTVDLHCLFAGSWSVNHDPAASGHVPYHLILGGHSRMRAGETDMELEAGDVLLFPHGAAHTLRSMQGDENATRPPTPPVHHFNGVLTEVTRPGDGDPLDMLCGTFVLKGPGSLLLRTLPDVLRVRTAGRVECAWLVSLIRMMQSESEAPQPGSAAVIGELSTALFTIVLRTLIAERGTAHGLLALMGDPRLSRALEAVLRAPEHPWTIATLAEQSNMSRATFARQFTQLSGMTPLELVTGLRMELAARLLSEEKLSAARVGEQCGYVSQAAFGRVFKQHYGVGPGAYRRAVRLA
jgi:AraC family transcriptional regulator, activator of mtrCDE